MNNLSLYDIANGFNQLMETEEITDEVRAEIEKQLTEMLQTKSTSIIGYYKNIELSIEAMKNEEKRIADNRKVLENKLESFKEYIQKCLEQIEGNKVETALGTISLAKCPLSVEIIDDEKLPNKYKKTIMTVTIDKTAIKNDFKETGEMVEGVRYITDKRSVRIK
jgi:hypothetical protein